MKVTYDDEVQAAYIYLQEPKPGISKKAIWLDNGILLDLDDKGKPVGFELLLGGSVPQESRKIMKKHFDIKRHKKW